MPEVNLPRQVELILDRLRIILEARILHPLRHEWDMSFVDSGASALKFMERSEVDVVVSDMRMPGMNGAQLLNEVMRRYPRTVRLILSGDADQELILKCVGSAHQCLSKPCDPSALRATVARAIDPKTSLKNEPLQRLIAQMDHLPSVPALYAQIVEKMHDPDVSLDVVGDIIGQDIGMTAKILKLVNSAYFGLRREISSPTEAVVYLGLDTVKSLVLSLNAFSQFDSVRVGSFSLVALWDHSLSTAAAAKRIARMQEAEQRLVDEAFVSGLLHDAGKVALAINFPRRYDEALRLVVEQKGDALTAEQHLFGANHAEVGGYLLGLWGLPVPVVEAIALHHRPTLSLNREFSPLTAVHVANSLVRVTAVNGATPTIDLEYLEDLSLTDRLSVWREELNGGS